MAQSRLNKAASIFTRVDGLIKTNLIPWADRPLWYDIYKAFPPKRDPLYRSILAHGEKPKLPAKIFYKEDVLRAYYFKNLKPLGVVVLNSDERKPIWELFIEEYNRLASEGNVPKEKLVANAVAEIQNKGYFIGFKKADNNQNRTDENQAERKEFHDILEKASSKS